MRSLVNAWRRHRYSQLIADLERVRDAMVPGEKHFVYPLSRKVELRPGRIYPALTRLEHYGWVDTGWEDVPVHPRRWYRLTEEGRRRAIPQTVVVKL